MKKTEFCTRDTFYGQIIGSNSKGVYIRLPTGDIGFAYSSGRVGTYVLASIKKIFSNGNILLSIDSFDYSMSA